MPDPFGPEALAAQRKTIAQAAGAGGRQSTILTSPATRAAKTTIAGSYQGTKLGGGA
jgi:hypothetical protein